MNAGNAAPVVRLAHADGRPRSYPAAVVHAGVVYPCGQVPVDADGHTPAGIADQVRLVLANLADTLRQAGSDLGALLQLTVYLVDPDDFDEYDRAYRQVFADIPMPPRTTVFVAAFRGAKRIELTACAAALRPADGAHPH